MRKYLPEPKFRYLRNTFLLCVVYFASARLAFDLTGLRYVETFMWPGAGLGLAILILYGYNLWPGITIGIFLAYLSAGFSPFVAIGIALGHTLGAIFGTYILRRNITLYRSFERLNDTLTFIILASLISSVINASVATLTLVSDHIIPLATSSYVWLSLWISNGLSILVVTPFLLTWLRPTRPWNVYKISRIEILSFGITVIGSSLIIFWEPFPVIKDFPLFYLISLPMIWAGLRFGSRGLTFSSFIVSSLAMLGTLLGLGPFATNMPARGLLFLEIFLAGANITFLIFLSIVKERGHAVRDLKQHVGKLETALHSISSADKAKNDFLAILAHELRNPLAPVMSSIELMKIEAGDTKVKNLASTMETHVKNMSRLLDDLLDISRISREKFTIEKEILNLQNAAVHSIKTVDHLIKKASHTLSVVMPPEPIWLLGDPLRVEQMIVNLLTNAAKYTEPGGKISLIIRKDKNVANIHVKDNGIGIPDTVISQIFDPFLQIQKTEKSSKGLGIGLSLTKSFAELHNGHIVVKSQGLGFGSEFILTLPIIEEIDALFPNAVPSKNERVATPEPLLRSQGNKFKILVVDDNEAAADSLAALLRHSGHAVEVAYTGESALQKTIENPAEIILLDISLPGMDGYETAVKLRELAIPITLIAITGYGQDEDKQKALDAGFDYHLTKPVSIHDVVQILDTL